MDSNKITATIDRLRRRISERFPESGLLKVSETCLTIAQHARERAEFIDRPIYWLRALIWLIVIALVSGSLCSRIWQKTMVLYSLEGPIAHRPAPVIRADSHSSHPPQTDSSDKNLQSETPS